MTPEELAEELRSGAFRPAYLVAGPEALLREEAVSAIRAAVVDPASADFNHDRLEGDATTPGRLLDAVRTLPVLAERRLVELREPEAGRRGGLGDAIAEAIPTLKDPSVVLLVTAAKIDKRSKWVKAFAKPSALVACDAPKNAKAAVGFVARLAKRSGLELGPGAADLLVESIGPQLLLLRSELEKASLLAGPGETVTRKHVSESVCAVAEQPIWDLTDAIGEGRTADAIGVLGRLLGAGAPPPVLLGTLASHFRKLARTRAGEPPRGHPFMVRKLESQARRYSVRRLVTCLDAIHEVDAVLKGQGGLPSDLALERLVMGLAA